jgi:hypothetical protein
MPEQRHQLSELDRICEIAARLNEDAAALRSLGLQEAAQLLAMAEAHLDNRVYANGFHLDQGSGLLPAVSVAPAQPRGRRGKARPARH